MKKKRTVLVLLIISVLLCLSGCSKKENVEDPFDFSNIEPKDLNPWTYIQDTALSTNSVIRDLASSSGELGIVLGVTGMVFSIFYMAIRICFSRSAGEKEEIKREATLKGMVAIMIFSIPFWLGLFKQFSELLV